MVRVIGGKLYRSDLKDSSYREVVEISSYRESLQFLCERNPGKINSGLSYWGSTLYGQSCFHRFISNPI